jgi:hypothetical protein
MNEPKWGHPPFVKVKAEKKKLLEPSAYSGTVSISDFLNITRKKMEETTNIDNSSRHDNLK